MRPFLRARFELTLTPAVQTAWSGRRRARTVVPRAPWRGVQPAAGRAPPADCSRARLPGAPGV